MATFSFSYIYRTSSSSPSKINSKINLPSLILNIGVTIFSYLTLSILILAFIPKTLENETKRFRIEILNKLSKNKESFEGDLDKAVDVCSEIFSNFLHKEYGGPGTLLVEPFTDMLVARKEKKLAGAPMAAREALLWAQNYLDKDWETWTKNLPK
ncbi:hypothetical protein MKX01_024204 [Papaver californicum]|nr:hypothetical protein MKX01_024204 [Papaver californicum]